MGDTESVDDLASKITAPVVGIRELDDIFLEFHVVHKFLQEGTLYEDREFDGAERAA